MTVEAEIDYQVAIDTAAREAVRNALTILEKAAALNRAADVLKLTRPRTLEAEKQYQARVLQTLVTMNALAVELAGYNTALTDLIAAAQALVAPE